MGSPAPQGSATLTDGQRIEFTVPGHSVALARPRVYVRRGARGIPGIRFHTPDDVRGWKECIAWHARKVLGPLGPLTEPLSVELRIHRRGKPIDIDNAAKAILDAMNKVMYHDDRQVRRLLAEFKAIDEYGERVEIVIEALP